MSCHRMLGSPKALMNSKKDYRQVHGNLVHQKQLNISLWLRKLKSLLIGRCNEHIIRHCQRKDRSLEGAHSVPCKVFSKPEQMLSGKTATGSSFRKSFRRLATESTSPSLTRSTFSPWLYFCFSFLILFTEPLMRNIPTRSRPVWEEIWNSKQWLHYHTCVMRTGSQKARAPLRKRNNCKNRLFSSYSWKVQLKQRITVFRDQTEKTWTYQILLGTPPSVSQEKELHIALHPVWGFPEEHQMCFFLCWTADLVRLYLLCAWLE